MIDYLSSQPHFILECIFDNLLIIEMIKVSMCNKDLSLKCNSKHMDHYWTILNPCIKKIKEKSEMIRKIKNKPPLSLNVFSIFKSFEKSKYNDNLKLLSSLTLSDPKRRTYKTCLKSILKDKFNLDKITHLNGEEYVNLCMDAIKEKKSADILYNVNHNFFNLNQYENLILDASNYDNDVYILSNFTLSRISNETYFKICLNSAQKNGLKTLKTFYLNEFQILDMNNTSDTSDMNNTSDYEIRLTTNQYNSVCLEAINNNISSFEFIIPHLLNNEMYANICFKCVNHNEFRLFQIQRHYLTQLDYFKLCKIIVKKRGWEIFNVNKVKLTSEQYREVCKDAVEQDIDAFQFINDLKCDKEFEKYKKLYNEKCDKKKNKEFEKYQKIFDEKIKDNSQSHNNWWSNFFDIFEF